AKEMGGKNITANVIAPGFIQTDMTDVLPDQIKDGVKQMTALRRMGEPDEIAAAGGKFTSHLWRSASIGNLGGWQVVRAQLLLHVLTGSF
ncbi:MAG: SDR family oxidoreductase, partial [Phycisphaeraceae bacterium]